MERNMPEKIKQVEQLTNSLLSMSKTLVEKAKLTDDEDEKLRLYLKASDILKVMEGAKKTFLEGLNEECPELLS